MPRWIDADDEWDGDLDHHDQADESDVPEDEDEEPTISCPHCRREVHEDAQRCPHCETYLSEEDSPRARKPWWILAGVGLCLYIVYYWIVG